MSESRQAEVRERIENEFGIGCKEAVAQGGGYVRTRNVEPHFRLDVNKGLDRVELVVDDGETVNHIGLLSADARELIEALEEALEYHSPAEELRAHGLDTFEEAHRYGIRIEGMDEFLED